MAKKKQFPDNPLSFLMFVKLLLILKALNQKKTVVIYLGVCAFILVLLRN